MLYSRFMFCTHKYIHIYMHVWSIYFTPAFPLAIYVTAVRSIYVGVYTLLLLSLSLYM